MPEHDLPREPIPPMPMPDTVQEFVSTRLAFCDPDLETNSAPSRELPLERL